MNTDTHAALQLRRQLAQRAAELEQHERERPLAIRRGRDALARLLPVAHGGTHGSGYVRRFLLGLYNSSKWPFKLTDLRGLDRDITLDCIDLLRMDALYCEQEIHHYIDDGDDVFRRLWKLESGDQNPT